LVSGSEQQLKSLLSAIADEEKVRRERKAAKSEEADESLAEDEGD
jgi:hypothetical protein